MSLTSSRHPSTRRDKSGIVGNSQDKSGSVRSCREIVGNSQELSGNCREMSGNVEKSREMSGNQNYENLAILRPFSDGSPVRKYLEMLCKFGDASGGDLF